MHIAHNYPSLTTTSMFDKVNRLYMFIYEPISKLEVSLEFKLFVSTLILFASFQLNKLKLSYQNTHKTDCFMRDKGIAKKKVVCERLCVSV